MHRFPISRFFRSITWRRWIQGTLAIALCLTLVFGQGDAAYAARSGGRLGGGSFRSAPSRTYRAPSSRSYAPSPVSPYGGGFGFNPFFFLPFFGFGGGIGGLLGLMVLLTIGGFLVRTLQSVVGNEGGGSTTSLLNRNPTVSVVKVQVGLSSQAKELQSKLNRLALTADTNTNQGLIKVLQETTLGLLRNPEYWCYGDVQSIQTKLTEGESCFNRLLLEERSKLSGETLSSVKGQVQHSEVSTQSETLQEALAIADSRSYIVVTVLVAIDGKLSLGAIQNEADLRQSIQLMGAVSADQLLSLEILWSPQSTQETLSADELMLHYPHLTVV